MMSIFNRYICQSCRLYMNIPKTMTNKVTQIRGLRLSKSLRDQKTEDANKTNKTKLDPSTIGGAKRRPEGLSWKTLFVAVGAGSLFVCYINYVKTQKKNLELAKQEVTTLAGKAAIGGPWTLVDFNGELKTSKDYHGKWLLIYFGFTHCPDICPEELEKIVEVVDKIDANPNVPSVTPLFVTVDPDRDSIGIMKEYLKEFSPKMIGFTGTAEQVDNICKAFRVYYSKGPKDEDGDYIVDHTIITYLVGPDGSFVHYYGQSAQVPEFTKGVIDKMNTYKPHYDNKDG